MKAIKRVCILGAGAMGAAYAAMFSDAGGFDVFFVARGRRLERLRQGTMAINGRRYEIPAFHPDEARTPADLILVALKHHHLTDALADIKPLVGAHTIILSVMNGLESEEIIGRIYGMDKMVYAIAVGIDAVREADVFSFANPGKIVFGVDSADPMDQRVTRLQGALDRAGIPNEVPQDIKRSLWWKFMINVGINQASAVLRAPYGVFQSSPDARKLMKMLMTEVIDLAREADIDLGREDLDAWCGILDGLSALGKTSMLQDIEAGRKTEVEIFAGKVAALGQQYRVPTPVNDTVMHIIKVLESVDGPLE